jgi:hypothetical protein
VFFPLLFAVEGFDGQVSAFASVLMFECLPDDPASNLDETTLKMNQQRLKFYEHFGARPVINTGYEVPTNPNDDIGAFIVMDPLDTDFRLSQEVAKKHITAVHSKDYFNYLKKSACPYPKTSRYTHRFFRSGTAPDHPKIWPGGLLLH